ncbi:dual specificity protein phosphatase 1 isoform X1 [Prunus yedoensis var. nudiflora]|uniref:protein-tyrosine-phosphatase n=1 Tax=Prunus yedoensis var. nudiflora TaxID=2094558 RepID=A0A314YMX5_PRUYE|nr:dual specificity protein phosphatase 1 isoform X1 [Prunus yedoensis var. nudiflora]
MDQMDESLKKQIAALLRVIHVTRCSKEDNVPCQIEEGLFLGSIGAANNKEELKNLNITHILTVVADRVSTDLKQHFDECIDYIDEAKRSGGGVLVHCFVGRSRSVTIVVAYLMKKHGMNLSQALEHVKSRRPQAAPNSGFISQLQSFERALHADEENKTM